MYGGFVDNCYTNSEILKNISQDDIKVDKLVSYYFYRIIHFILV